MFERKRPLGQPLPYPRQRPSGRLVCAEISGGQRETSRANGLISKPHIRDTAAVARQVIERVQAVEVIDGEVRDWPRFCEPQVDGDAAAAVRVEAQAAPASDAAAPAAKVNLECWLRPVVAGVDRARPGDFYLLAVVVIDPQHPVAPAETTIARGDAVGHAVKCPSKCAAMAASGQH